jgi:hypothetical protein
MMVLFTNPPEILEAFILFLSSTHLYYNAPFLRRNIAQWNSITPPTCNLSTPQKKKKKKNHFLHPEATQIHLVLPTLELITLLFPSNSHYLIDHHQSFSRKGTTPQKMHPRPTPHHSTSDVNNE